MSECYLVLDTTASTRTVSTLGYWNCPRAAPFAVKVCSVAWQSDHLLTHVLDFQALENMAMAQDEDQAAAETTPEPEPEPAESSTYPPQHHSSTPWFTKYMNFAQRKRRNRGLMSQDSHPL